MKYAIYSDGSYKNGIWGAGAVILQETPFGFNPVQELSFFGEDADGIRNVAGEIYGVLEALRLLFKINQSSRDVDSVTVYHVTCFVCQAATIWCSASVLILLWEQALRFSSISTSM